MTATSHVVCPVCKGAMGHYEDTGDIYEPHVWVKCPRCHGTGQIPSESPVSQPPEEGTNT